MDGLSASEDPVIRRKSRLRHGCVDHAVSWYERNVSTGALSYGGMLKDGLNGVDVGGAECDAP